MSITRIALPELWGPTSVGAAIAQNLDGVFEALATHNLTRVNMLLGALHADADRWADKPFSSRPFIAAARAGVQLSKMLPRGNAIRAMPVEDLRARILAVCALLDIQVHL